MSTCKDCLHYEVCHFTFKGCELTEEEKKDCGFFKPKADYVEVVRCKDCKYAKYLKLAGVLSCLYWNTHSTEENSFCSYGERKESEVRE
ncbi:MAG: hypothetical protein UHD64_10085 [Bacteroidales bacterium]|nr:hypothetical protein [Bacteroidales bacterium]